MSPIEGVTSSRFIDEPDCQAIPFSALERTKRIDAEYFQKRYIRTAEILRECNVESVVDCAGVSDGNHFSISEKFVERGIPYYRGQDVVGNFFVEQADPIHITKDAFYEPWMCRSHLQRGDVLLSIIGTIGELSVVSHSTPATCSCKLAILRPRNIEPEYLATFLRCSFGRSQIERLTRGAVQMGILLEDMDQLSVVRLSAGFEKRVAQQVRDAKAGFENAKARFSEAESTFASALGLGTWKPPSRSSFIRRYSDVCARARMDAEHYQEEFYAASQQLKQAGALRFIPMEDLLVTLTNGHTPLHHDLTIGEVPFLCAEHVSNFQVHYSSDKRILLKQQVIHPRIPSIPLAVRVYPEPSTSKQNTGCVRNWSRPHSMLIFDTETTVDSTQRLLFGSYRFIDQGVCREEGIFYADDPSKADLAILERYVANHRADSPDASELKLLSRSEFLKKFFTVAYKLRALIVGFNLPFDLSRLGFEVSDARREYRGGFSLGLWSYRDRKGREFSDPNRPRITIKHIDSKRALMSLTGRKGADPIDQIPDGSKDGRPQKGYRFRGHFLDVKTLAFALTDRGHSLKSACEAFGIERGKLEVSKHGELTEEYIDYNRRDVEATARLAQKLLDEYARHPIALPETKAFSPASIGRSYLREMGITPIMQRQSNLQPHVGYAQTAYFGGRTSAHIRKVAVPIVYVDFLSMYPTVNSLMNLWRFVIAEKIRIVDHCHDAISKFLQQITVESLFRPAPWGHFAAFVRVIPNGDILPTRAQYSTVSNDWQVGLNHLHASTPDDSLWFSLPDVVASVILTGRIPKIIDAFRIEPSAEKLKGLKPVKLQGGIEIDPSKGDFFKAVIEERKRIESRADLAREEKDRMSKTLKVLANSTSYGIFAQMDPHENENSTPVICHGIDASPYICNVSNFETPGEFCFPPLASLITGGARLMLALLESCVTDLGGTYAMEDTDSMAIVATQHGGSVPCPGGPLKMRRRPDAVNALSWSQVREISNRFEALNPYDRRAVPGSILKIEDDNSDPATGKQREIWCLAISAKRYVLFLKGKSKLPALLRRGPNGNSKDNHWSEHGLGHLLNPTDYISEDRAWIAQFWHSIIGNCLGVETARIGFERLPAIGRVTITSPAILVPLAELNGGKKYRDQIKPFNFLLTCHISPLGHPLATDPAKFHLIAPFESNSRKWLQLKWIDQYSGKKYKITTEKNFSSRTIARVQTYGDVLLEYAHHPEPLSQIAKFLNA